MQRFWDKVNKSEGCWNWVAAVRGKTGYGAIKVDGKVIDAHRLSWMLSKGDIPSGMYVCHTCDNRRCVNPDHLFLGSAKDNFQDAIAKGRIDFKGRNSKRIKHPSRSAYRRGCRCSECLAINTDYTRQWRKRRGTETIAKT